MLSPFSYLLAQTEKEKGWTDTWKISATLGDSLSVKLSKTNQENNQVSSLHSSTWCVLTWELLLEACLTIMDTWPCLSRAAVQPGSWCLLFLTLAHPSQPKQSHPGRKPGAELRLVMKRFKLGCVTDLKSQATKSQTKYAEALHCSKRYFWTPKFSYLCCHKLSKVSVMGLK